MARIAFFTERIPGSDGAVDTDPIAGFSYDLMLSLADQQHDVNVFTTYRVDEPGPTPHPRMRILRPFKNWGWLELPRLIPLLIDFQPEILHLIEPRAESLRGFTNAMSAIPTFAPLIGRPRVVVSFYDLNRADLFDHRQILFASDVVTVSTRQQEKLVRDWLSENRRRTSTSLVPLPSRALRGVTDTSESEVASVSPALAAFVDGSGFLILVPGDISDHVEPKRLFSLLAETLRLHPQARVLFAGGWGRTRVAERGALMAIFENARAGARVLVSGPLSPAAEALCLERTGLVFMASLRGESLSLARWNREALEAQVPVVMSAGQCELDPLPWRNRESAFVVDSEGSSWGATLADAIAHPDMLRGIRARLTDFARSEALDQPGNLMSRIYAQVLGGSSLRGS